MSSPSRYEREPNSAPGDFYVENHCCTACGVPLLVAPDLIGYVDSSMSHCYWKKQPETEHELDQAIAIFEAQELGCHRYAGHDPIIQRRVGYSSCDYPLPHIKALAATRNLFLLPLETPGLLRRLWNKLCRRE